MALLWSDPSIWSQHPTSQWPSSVPAPPSSRKSGYALHPQAPVDEYAFSEYVYHSQQPVPVDGYGFHPRPQAPGRHEVSFGYVECIDEIYSRNGQRAQSSVVACDTPFAPAAADVPLPFLNFVPSPCPNTEALPPEANPKKSARKPARKADTEQFVLSCQRRARSKTMFTQAALNLRHWRCLLNKVAPNTVNKLSLASAFRLPGDEDSIADIASLFLRQARASTLYVGTLADLLYAVGPEWAYVKQSVVRQCFQGLRVGQLPSGESFMDMLTDPSMYFPEAKRECLGVAMFTAELTLRGIITKQQTYYFIQESLSPPPAEIAEHVVETVLMLAWNLKRKYVGTASDFFVEHQNFFGDVEGNLRRLHVHFGKGTKRNMRLRFLIQDVLEMDDFPERQHSVFSGIRGFDEITCVSRRRRK